MQEQMNTVVKATVKEVKDLPLVECKKEENGSYLLIYEKTPTEHLWYNAILKDVNIQVKEMYDYDIVSVPHVGKAK